MIYLIRSIKTLWIHKKSWIFLSLLLTIFLGIFPLINLTITNYLVNNISNIILGNSKDYKNLVVIILLQIICLFIIKAMSSVQMYLNQSTEFKLDYILSKELLKKANSLPYSKFEDPEFYNHFTRINGRIGQSFLNPISRVLESIQCVIQVFSYTVILINYHWIVLLLCLFSVVPIIINQFKFNNRQFWLTYNQTPNARESKYINLLLTSKDSAKEIRVLNIGNLLLNRWAKTYFSTGQQVLKLSKKNVILTVCFDGVSHLFTFCSYGVIIFAVISRKLRIGDFVTAPLALQGLQSSIIQVGFNLASIYSESLYLKDLFNYLDYSDESKNNNQVNLESFNKSIKLKNVGFHYPNSDQMVLKELNLEIKKGETIAIVGENGSGKSTLVKCLMGLYEPTSGEIYFDNYPLSKIRKSSLWANISVVFQDFIKYNFTIKDNIAFGNVNEQNNMSKLEEVARKCGLDKFIEKQECGYDTFLGKFLKEGIDLSGGQWQRLAIARAIFKNSEILILDEPTASLDPKTELEIYDRFKEIASKKTTLIISHRMATTTFADKVIVLKNGEIIEIGTPQELMNSKNEFYKMYISQSKWYIKEVI
jgi:ATP-binding cassette subfamily B protein